MDKRYPMKILWRRILGGGNLLPPKYKHDVGFDLVVAVERELQPISVVGAPTDIPCGIEMALPDDVACIVISRSSAVKKGIIAVPTLIDPGYRGPMYIFAYNMTAEVIRLSIGDRIAQIVPIYALGAAMMAERTEGGLPWSERSVRGFGSSGGVPK